VCVGASLQSPEASSHSPGSPHPPCRTGSVRREDGSPRARGKGEEVPQCVPLHVKRGDLRVSSGKRSDSFPSPSLGASLTLGCFGMNVVV
jgi:hypothetical protein